MFDWSGKEVANIVWAEDDESDDHIVPFSKEGEENQRGISGESLKKVLDKDDDKSSSSQRVLSAKTDGPGLSKLEIYTQHEVHKRNCVTAMSLWPDLSLSDVSRTGQDSFDTELSNNLTEITKLDSSKDVAPQVNKGSEAFQNEDADRVQGDFLDYGWANIGSFDDLDRIFSNEDSIFGNANLGNEDELWSSSKTVTGSPENFFPPSLDSSSPELGAFKGSSNHYENNLAFLGKTSSLNTQLGTKGMTTASLNDNLTGKVLVSSRKSSRRRGKNSERKGWPDYHATWTNSGNQFHQLDGQLGPSILPRKTQFPISVPSQYHPFAYPMMNPNQDQYGSKTVLPHTYLQEDDRKGILPYEACPTNLDRNTSDALPQPLRMTPQEKIEKLRRRQQMQALLAIKKQQQQYSHQVSLDEHPKIQPEVNNTCFDPKSSEQEESGILSVVVDDCCSTEVAILHQIQNKIDKLDVNTRLCMRDSLFRLAQSAKLRLYSNDTISSNGSSIADPLRKEESTHDRLSQAPDTETETNSIDRAVAHLLFHRSLEPPSLGKLPRTPESPGSSTLPLERKRKVQTLYHSSGSRSSLLSLEGVASRNASNVESAKVEGCLEAEPQTQLSYEDI